MDESKERRGGSLKIRNKGILLSIFDDA